jgi:DNA-binding NarL/FixJ family response regulator
LSGGNRITLLLVDDQQLFAENLRIVIESRTKDMRVVGVASDGHEAVAMADSLLPAIILMDVRMPRMDGVKATEIIHERHPEIRIVMLTTFDDDEYVFHALRHGAVGYLLKNIPPAELFASIRAVKEGSVLVVPSVAEKLLRVQENPPPSKLPQRLEELRLRVESLTPREQEILRLISQAYDNREIAQKLCIAEQTAKNYISVIYSKLDVTKRMQLMQVYQEYQKITGK